MNNYSSLLEAIEGLKKEGYTKDFNLENDCIHCKDDNIRLHPSDFVIDKYFRFEENTDPGEQSIIYAISSEKYGIKGTMINAYGIYAEQVTDELLSKLEIQPHG